MSMKDVKMFVKEHKKEIAIGAIVTTASIVGCVLLRKNFNTTNNSDLVEFTLNTGKDLPKPSKSVGRWAEFWIDGGTKWPTAIINDVPMQYLGDFGAEILDHCAENNIEQILFDTHANIIIEFMDK